MTAKKVKVGVFGVGNLGIHHARIYAELPETELVGIYDVDRARAEEAARRHGTSAWQDMAALAQAIEAASIVVPTDRHMEVAGPLIDAGVHCLVEKPIAATTSEAETLVARAEQAGTILQVGHIERFNPVLAFLDDLPARPRFIEAHRLAPYPPVREGLHPRGTEVSVVLDLMIHDLEVILHLVQSEVRELRAVGVPVLSPSEDIANVRLAFQNGCVANITASRISPEKMRKIRVFFADRYVSLDYQNQTGEMYRKQGQQIVCEAVPIEKGEPLLNELRSFAACVAERGEPLVSGQHAARALQLAARISHLIREEGA